MAFVFNGLSYKNKNFTKEDLLITVLFIRKKPDQFFINKNIYSIYAFLIGWGLGADMNNIAVEFVTYIAQKKGTGCVAPSDDLISFEEGMDLLVEFLQMESKV